ncbi:uncharacterized protein CMC5_040300 [Chondromyces crocatus]|uniref:Uncharacterized protein n=1 Tax=Chondromyces crocatus TaxID=52 RepID=A0A0K1EG97_CHOCO|nr:uncharacterized protein CMC5_040300 [Chondromyces crocatus]
MLGRCPRWHRGLSPRRRARLHGIPGTTSRRLSRCLIRHLRCLRVPGTTSRRLSRMPGVPGTTSRRLSRMPGVPRTTSRRLSRMPGVPRTTSRRLSRTPHPSSSLPSRPEDDIASSFTDAWRPEDDIASSFTVPHPSSSLPSRPEDDITSTSSPPAGCPSPLRGDADGVQKRRVGEQRSAEVHGKEPASSAHPKGRTHVPSPPPPPPRSGTPPTHRSPLARHGARPGPPRESRQQKGYGGTQEACGRLRAACGRLRAAKESAGGFPLEDAALLGSAGGAWTLMSHLTPRYSGKAIASAMRRPGPRGSL